MVEQRALGLKLVVSSVAMRYQTAGRGTFCGSDLIADGYSV